MKKIRYIGKEYLTKKKVKGKPVKKRPKRKVSPMPKALSGPEAMQEWLGLNSDLFNVTRIETLTLLPASTLRQVVAQKRKLSHFQYARLKEFLLPKLMEGANILVGSSVTQ